MGLVDRLTGSEISMDTAPFIYFIERNETYLDVVRPVFAEIDAGRINAVTSTVTLLEVLVHPFRMNDTSLAEKYREILLYSEGITTCEVINEISETASKLRAEYSIRAPDALQIATGIFYGTDSFLTNDKDLKRVNDIEILVVDDFV